MLKRLACSIVGVGILLVGRLEAQSATLRPVADSTLEADQPNDNQGSANRLRVRGDEAARALVDFDAAEIAARVGVGGLVSATLEFEVASTAGRDRGDAVLDLHRATEAWREGGVTWRCANDTDPGNDRTDCAQRWNGGRFAAEPSASVPVPTGARAVARFDVTSDVAAIASGAPAHGWLLKLADEEADARIDLESRERGGARAPRLVLVIESATDDPAAPRLAITRPVGRFVVGEPQVAIEVSYQDLGSGVDPASLRVAVDGVAASCTPGAASATCAAPTLASGSHAIAASVSDRAGNRATTERSFELLLGPGPHTVVLTAVADTELRREVADRNFGRRRVLALGGEDDHVRRDVVRFDAGDLGTLATRATIVSARVRLTPADDEEDDAAPVAGAVPDSVAGDSNRRFAVDVHRVTREWREERATWNCPSDGDLGDRNPDCPERWNGGAFATVATGSAQATEGSSAVVSWNVTADVAALAEGGAHFGWLFKKRNESARGEVAFRSREAGAASAPRLEVTLAIGGTDTVPPSIVAAVDPAANAAGWHRTPATVTFTCTDAESGIASCTEPVTIATDGADQEVVGTAVDRAGNRATATVAIDFDGTPPTAVATAAPPANAAGWHVGDVAVSFACADALSGVASCPGSAVVTAEGVETVSGLATDVAGNESPVALTVRIDRTPPSLAVTSPASGAVVADAQLTIEGTLIDALSGVASASCDGVPGNVGTGGFSCVVSLAPGENSISVRAEDRAGNAATTTVVVTLAEGDRTAPTIAIVEPPQGSYVLEARPVVVIAAADETALDASTLALAVGGQQIPASCVEDGARYRCLPEADLADGPVTLRASIADAAGNGAAATASFVVDTAGLGLEITAPVDGAVTRDDRIVVAGTAAPGVARVEVNGVAAPIAGGAFSVEVPLREGTNMLVALATKVSGRTGTDSIQVTRDIFAPIVRIDSPRDGFVAVGDRVAVTGLVNDIVPAGAEATVVVNGVPAAVGGGAFLIDALPLVPGPNRIEAVATDRAGNVARHAISVLFQPPVGARLAMGNGNGQTGPVGQTLTAPLVAVVRDDFGNPVAGRLVRFQVTRNSGFVSAAASGAREREIQVPTDGAGRASAYLTLGATSGVGTNRVTATAIGVAGEVEFCATAVPLAADKVLMTRGDNQRGVVGAPLPLPLEALVVDRGGNPVPGVAVTFAVTRGSGSLDGASSTVRVTGLDGQARAVLTLGADPGINNNVVAATFDGNPGLPASFSSSGLLAGPASATAYAGVVLDDAMTPIPGALVSLGGTAISTLTDDQGQFELAGVPPGALHLHIDPTDSPRPETFPPLAFETVAIAGQRNQLGQPILIPALDTASSKLVGGAQDVTLEMAGVDGLTLTVFANSVTCPDGSHTCRITISQVHLDKVPMPPPSGTFFMPPAWTIQPHGVVFDPPARITIPNDGLAAGRMIDIFQFDHALNQFINVGKGTVSEDASIIVSDPGFGITRAGWGGCGQPPPPNTCGDGCDDKQVCNGVEKCVDGKCQPGTPPPDGTTCDDKDKCTVNDKCMGKACKGEKVEVKITDAPATICKGRSKPVTATTTPAGRSLTWTSSNPAVLGIAGGGTTATATGIAKGNAAVKAVDAQTQCASDSRNIRVIEKEEFDGMGEKTWCALNAVRPSVFSACRRAYQISNDVIAWQANTFRNSDPSCRGEGSAADAARHARWSCELTSDPDTSPYADEIMGRHENRPDDACESHEQDFNNNERGRGNGRSGRNCAQAALQDLAAGRLQMNSPPAPGKTCP